MKKKDKVNSSLSVDELNSKINELNEQLVKLKLQKSTGQLLNTAIVRLTRKELVRANTFLTQKQSSASASAKR